MYEAAQGNRNPPEQPTQISEDERFENDAVEAANRFLDGLSSLSNHQQFVIVGRRGRVADLLIPSIAENSIVWEPLISIHFMPGRKLAVLRGDTVFLTMCAGEFERYLTVLPFVDAQVAERIAGAVALMRNPFVAILVRGFILRQCDKESKG